MKLIHRVAICLLVMTGAVQADAVDDIVRAQMEKQHIPGVSLAVVKDGKPVKIQSYGFANLELRTQASADTVYRIGSVSKQIVATAVMLLVQDGKLSLDDKMVKFLEGPPATWNDITVRQLLSHTSGLVREGPGFDPLKVQNDAAVIKSAYEVPLVFKPGEKWQYSNLGYFILAEIITKVSGQPWPEFVTARVFKPLGMSATFPMGADPIVPNRADGYSYVKGAHRNSATILALRPSGAFMSSVTDLLKWDAALNNGTLLPQEVLQTMWTPVPTADGAPPGYGLGWMTAKLGTKREVTHGGGINGFRSHYVRLPDERLSVIVLANSELSSSDAIAARVAALYVKDLFVPCRATSLAALDEYVGKYNFRNGGPVDVSRADGELLVNAPNAGLSFRLLPRSATEFCSNDDPRLSFMFKKGSDGRVTDLSVMSGAVEQAGGPKQN